jgi:hypothetical protein
MLEKKKDKVIKYWRSLLKYLEDEEGLDFEFIHSITITQGSYDHNGAPCDMEAIVALLKPGQPSANDVVVPGHLQECTWVD